jgi:hypothetical protein
MVIREESKFRADCQGDIPAVANPAWYTWEQFAKELFPLWQTMVLPWSAVCHNRVKSSTRHFTFDSPPVRQWSQSTHHILTLSFYNPLHLEVRLNSS